MTVELPRPRTLTDLVHAWIREAIVKGDLAPGTRITEAGVAAQLGVSKTPVRESLLRLREIGLLDDDGRRGHRIAISTRATIDQAYELREVLEPFTARIAAESGTLEAVRVIDDAAKRSMKHVEDRRFDEQAHRESDHAFHVAIAAAAGNRRILKAIADAAVLVYLAGPTVTETEATLGGLRSSAEEHLAIASAILRRDPDEAGVLTSRHLSRLRRAVADHLSQDITSIDDVHSEPAAG